MQLGDLFALSLTGRRMTPALEVDTEAGLQTLTFGEIDERAARMASVLALRGVAAGDRVAVQLPNSLAFLDLFLACLRLGAVFVPINVLYREREIGHILDDADPLLVAAASRDFFPDEAPVVAVEVLLQEAEAAQRLDRHPPVDGDQPAAIVYTSGTTGRAKGAVLSHNNFLANTVNLLACWRITEADRYLAVLPLFHVHGLANGVCAWLASGCRMRLVERFEHQKGEALFEAFRPTLFFGVPTIYGRLLDLAEDAAGRIGAAARLFVSGSAPLPAPVLEAFRARFGHTILERYGMSETLMLVSNPYDGERRPGTVGKPLPGVSLRVVDRENGGLPAGEVGHVQARGSNVFDGYWGNPDATAAAFTDGWFRTGDLGELSEDGYLTLCGRSTDLIISGGFNIYPREIEELLLEVSGVVEVAVVGAPDARRGEVPVAFVVASDDFDEAAARAACERGLASFKVPRRFSRVEALPRNALGKVQKHRLPEVTDR